MAPQESDAKSDNETPPNDNRRWILIGLAVLVVIAISVGVAVPLSQNNNNKSTSTNNNNEGGDSSGNNPDTSSSVVEWMPLGDNIDGQTLKDRFGFSVSATSDGKTVAVGAVSIDDAGSFRQVQVYTLRTDTGDDWVQVGQNLEGTSLEDDFGHSVSLSQDGSMLAVGTRNGNYVRVYQKSAADEWITVGSDITMFNATTCFGCAIDLSEDGTILAVGAWNREGDIGGVAATYQLDSSTQEWMLLGTPLEGRTAGEKWFGCAVALSSQGTTLVVGSLVGNYARTYTFVDGEWVQTGSDLEGEADNDQFGTNVAISYDGLTVAVSAPRNNDGGYGAGHIRVFEYKDDWMQVGGDLDGDNDGQFGFSMAMNSDGTRIIGGANLDDGAGVGFATGHVRILEFDGSEWVQRGDELVGIDKQDEFGQSVAMSADGNIIIVGTKFGKDVGGVHTGHVRVFEASYS